MTGKEQPVHDDAQLRQLVGYIGLVRDTLRMQNWDIILHPTVIDDPEDETLAQSWGTPNHTTWNIELGARFFDEAPNRIRNTMVHELVHAQHRDVDRLWESCTEENEDVPKAQTVGWSEDYHVFIERLVSWITNRICDTVPDYSPSRKYKVPAGVFMNGEHGA